jgi:hypothetical protein
MKTNLKTEVERLLATAEPAELGPGPRAGVLDEATIRKSLAGQEGASESLLALLLLWHDHHEPAHELAQANENADGNYVHAILHRREPDYSNAKYWFRRVGQHPAYSTLVARVMILRKAHHTDELLVRLAPGGRWDAMAFVDACEAGARARVEQANLLREIQKIEFEELAFYLVEAG